MRRVKWLKALWPQDLAEMAVKLKQLSYSTDKFEGFIIDRIRDEYIEARYIEKFVYSEKVTDPFGVDEVFERTSYQSTAFTLFMEFPQIEVRDAPRSTKELLNKLQEICNFSVAIVPISINLIELTALLQKEVAEEIVINSLQITDLVIEPGINAKVLIKGDTDVRSSLEEVVSNKKYLLEKIQLKNLLDRRRLAVNISSNGMAVIPDEGFAETSRLIRESINKLQKN